MKKGTLEKPYPFGSPPVKCLNCDSKSFAIHLPKNLDEEYGIRPRRTRNNGPKTIQRPLRHRRVLLSCPRNLLQMRRFTCGQTFFLQIARRLETPTSKTLSEEKGADGYQLRSFSVVCSLRELETSTAMNVPLCCPPQ